MASATWTLRTRAIAVGLAALTVLVYISVRHFDFVAVDDPLYVTDNPHVLGGLTWTNVVWAFTTVHAGYWIPLTWLSLMLDASLGGADATLFHLTNLALHIAATLTLFEFFRRATGAIGRSACVAALFAVHPLHVESVAWITERKDVLSTFCFGLMALAYLGYARRPTFGRHLVVAVCLVAGLMAKPMLVSVPVLLLLLDVWPLARLPVTMASIEDRARWRALIVEKLPLAACSIGFAALVVITQRQSGAMADTTAFPIADRVQAAVVACAIYIRQTLWPADLAVMYAFHSIAAWQAALAAVVLLALSAAAFVARRRHPYVLVGWLWFLVSLLPVSGLVQVGVQWHADRFTYVPLTGLFVAIVWGAGAWAERHGTLARRAAGIAATAAILACAVAAHAQAAYWRDGIALWQRAVDVDPSDFAAQDGLGTVLIGAGRLDESILHLKAALALDSDYVDTSYNLGVALMKAGRESEAETYLRHAIARKPEFAGAHSNLGLVLMRAGRTPEAIAEYRAAIAAQPALADAHNNLGAALASTGDLKAAIAEFRIATRLAPDFVSAHAQLGLALSVTGHPEEASQQFLEVLRLDPNNAGAKRALEAIERTH